MIYINLSLAAATVLVAGCSFDGSNQAVLGGPLPGADASVADFDAMNPLRNADAGQDQQPTISNIADQSTVRGPLGPITFTIGDQETPTTSLLVTSSSSDQNVVRNSKITLGGSGSSRTITILPDTSGTTTITLKVLDSAGQRATTSFALAVTNEAPIGVTDHYSAYGNTDITVDATAGVLANDSDADGDLITALPDIIVSLLGGSVNLLADGSFTYLPPVGVTARTDSFPYQVTDGFATSTGSAQIVISERTWYVKNDSAAGGDGRRTLPFDTLAEAETASLAGDTIFIYQGDGMSTGQSGGIVLKNDQRLLGEHVGLSFGVDILVPAVATNVPRITNAAGNGVTLAARNEIRGIRIENTGNRGISGTAVETLLVDAVQVDNSGGEGMFVHNINPSGTVTLILRNSFVTGTLSIPVGIDVGVAGTGGGRLNADITTNSISGIAIGIRVSTAGDTGNGLGGTNTATVIGNRISDVDLDGISVEPDGTSKNAFTVSTNLVDGNVALNGARRSGINVLYKAAATSSTALTILNNTVLDFNSECLKIAGVTTNNGGTLTARLANNTLSTCSRGMRIAPDGDTIFFASVDGNTSTQNTARSSYGFDLGVAHRLDLNLLNNEDDKGYGLQRSTSGTFNLAGLLGTGASFVNDNGNVQDRSNTTNAGAPNVNVQGGGMTKQINIITPNGFPMP